MTILFKRSAALLCFTTLLPIVGLGCNTAPGLDKDMQKAGAKIQAGTK